MRIWTCDPRLLTNKHLLGEHNELHVLLNTLQGKSKGWQKHPELIRFQNEEGIPWLIMRHECLRLTMNARWPNRHAEGEHPSDLKDIMQKENWPQTPQAKHLQTYHQLFLRGKLTSEKWWLAIGFPLTQLEHLNPWKRDAVPFSWYQKQQKNWTNQLVNDYHGGAPPADKKYHGSTHYD